VSRSSSSTFSATCPGLDMWFDRESLAPGQRWEVEIRAAIGSADFFVLLLSTRSVAKLGFYQREVREALRVLEGLPERQTFLIPARLDDCQVHFEQLAEIQYVDLFPDFLAGVAKIARVVEARKVRGPSQTRTGLSCEANLRARARDVDDVPVELTPRVAAVSAFARVEAEVRAASARHGIDPGVHGVRNSIRELQSCGALPEEVRELFMQLRQVRDRWNHGSTIAEPEVRAYVSATTDLAVRLASI
jgi:hypothetical protein